MEEMLNKLNDKQKEAVIYNDGPLLIIAGAGSGKTRVLTYKIAYLLNKCNIKPWEILSFTFTNKAAKEMKQRVSDLIGDTSSMWLGTFHSICVRILKREIEVLGFTKNFNIFDELDKSKLIKEIIKKLNIDEKTFSANYISSLISKAKDEMNDAKKYSNSVGDDFRLKVVASVYTEYEKNLKQYNSIDFDDIIMLTVKLLLNNPDKLVYYQNKFKYILVDEYQDTNKVQFKLISLLSMGHGNICVVGDESQSIYGWRGADISNILNFEKEFNNAKIIKLEENYRSTKNILSAANSVIKNNKSRIDKKLWTGNDEGDKIKYSNLNNEYEEIEYVVDEIDRICREEKKDYSSFALLYRTNAQSRVIEDVFMKAGTPYKLVGGLKFYSRKEIKDLTAYLKFIQNTNDNMSLKRIINTPKRGIGDTTIDKLEEIATNNNISMYEVIQNNEYLTGIRSVSNVINFRDEILKIIISKDKLKVSELMKYIIKETGYEDEINKEDIKVAENRFENLLEFIGVAIEFENESEDKSLNYFLESVMLVSDVDKLDDTDNAVTLMTLHSSKGLEYDVIFLVGLEEGLFPSSRSINEDDLLEEERRLFYVGITRAKQKLYLLSSKKRTMYGSTSFTINSRFLDEIPVDLYEEYNKNKKVIEAKVQMGNISKNKFGLSVDRFLKEINKKDVEIPEYEIGMKIKHKKFGIGIICNIEKEDDDFKLEINFNDVGFKRLMAKYTPLEILE
ncbi:MAG: UvrD-helicase domain-containing protein [Clostridia bacterium]